MDGGRWWEGSATLRGSSNTIPALGALMVISAINGALT